MKKPYGNCLMTKICMNRIHKGMAEITDECDTGYFNKTQDVKNGLFSKFFQGNRL